LSLPHASLCDHGVRTWQVFRRLARYSGGGAGAGGRALRGREASRRAAAARESKVALLRRYRKGELPDIETLNLGSMLDPLRARPRCPRGSRELLLVRRDA